MATAPFRVLTDADVQRFAPSVFADHPWEGVSDAYKFIPTSNVLRALRDQGFLPVKANQSRANIPGKAPFTKHMLRFRFGDNHSPVTVGDEIPEIVLTNAHDRSAAFKFYAGFFRLVCSNGMVVQSANLGSISVRHIGQGDFTQRILDATQEIIRGLPVVFGQIKTWKEIELTTDERLAYARSAAELRYKPGQIDPARLLVPRRKEDESNTLYGAFQTVQEHATQGGDRGFSPSGRRTTTRAIKAVDKDIKFNTALYRLTEEMARLKGAA